MFHPPQTKQKNDGKISSSGISDWFWDRCHKDKHCRLVNCENGYWPDRMLKMRSKVTNKFKQIHLYLIRDWQWPSLVYVRSNSSYRFCDRSKPFTGGLLDQWQVSLGNRDSNVSIVLSVANCLTRVTSDHYCSSLFRSFFLLSTYYRLAHTSYKRNRSSLQTSSLCVSSWRGTLRQPTF